MASTSTSVSVRLYGPVREAAGSKELSAPGETVGEVLAALFADHPDLEARVMADGEFRHQVQVFVDGRKLGTLDGLETRLSGEETVQVTAAMSGG